MGSCVVSGHKRRTNMEATKNLVVSLMLANRLVLGAPLPQQQQLTQQVLLAPLNVVRFTGNTAITTGQSVVHSVPDAVNTVSNVAVGAIDSVPDAIDNTVTFGANAINSVPDTI